jgi:nicotinate dehydrogenase subunit B
MFSSKMSETNMPRKTKDSVVQTDSIMDSPSNFPDNTQNTARTNKRPTSIHAQTYRWPIPRSGEFALLEVSANATASGELPTYRYRGSLERTLKTPSGVEVLPDFRPTSQSTFAYRHAFTSLALDDSHLHIPSLAHVFARESFWDEMANEMALDPVSLRLRHLDQAKDVGAREVIRMVTERAAWGRRPLPHKESPWLSGRGFAMDGPPSQARKLEGDGQTESNWSAWVVDIDVNRQTGDVAVRRVVAAYGEGRDGPPTLNGVPRELVESALSHALETPQYAQAAYDEVAGFATGNAVSFDVLADAPPPTLAADILQLSRSASKRAAAPAVAAIANAIFDATGVRFRQPPFTAAQLCAELTNAKRPKPIHQGVCAARPSRLTWMLKKGGVAGVIGGLVSVACSILTGPGEIAPVKPGSFDASTWSAATLERGRQIALAGDCAVCHTAPGGKENAGGFALQTPFGTIYSTNITPDAETGIGLWSYSAFERAMRKGIARDGKHLYPAFPYTAFAKISEPDMLALYAWLMSQPPVKTTPPKTSLLFPMNLRPSVAGWNFLFHDDAEFKQDPTQSAEWNRGKYLVDGAGHCGACHTPRNKLGAEKGGLAYLTGGEAEGWDAPPLVGNHGPVPWTEKSLFEYLRTGFSKEHGVATGPMGPVVAGLAQLPEFDVKAIAHYITSLSPKVEDATAMATAQHLADEENVVSTLGLERGRRTFETACAVCHASSGGVGHFGVRPLMSLNTSVSYSKPDNLLHVLLNGISNPATAELGYMPGFRDAYDDKQLAELAAYIRARYAPDQPAWGDLENASAAVRHASVH